MFNKKIAAIDFVSNIVCSDKVVLDDFYAGYTGGIRLIEDIYTVAVQRFN